MPLRYTALALLLFVAMPVFASAFMFVAPLKLGDSSPSVRELQRILNSAPDTRIADIGSGSPGNETDHFGALTKNAVIRFQVKYAADILTPVGLASATGYVGGFTLKKLNTVALGASIPARGIPAQVVPLVASLPSALTIQTPAISTSPLPTITKLSKTSFSPGETIKINGTGFVAPVSVYIGDYVVAKPRINSSTEIEAVVPNQRGVFLVWVGNKYGDSRASYPMFIIVPDGTTDVTNIAHALEKQNTIIQNRATGTPSAQLFKSF